MGRWEARDLFSLSGFSGNGPRQKFRNRDCLQLRQAGVLLDSVKETGFVKEVGSMPRSWEQDMCGTLLYLVVTLMSTIWSVSP